ncbi:unnamed protein product [Calypogeia fissa]
MQKDARTEEQGLKTSRGVILFDIWGNSNGEFVYGGYDLPLTDGRECTLGTYARRRRGSGAVFPAGEQSHAQSNHNYKPIRDRKYMFQFDVQVEGEVMAVWEKAESQLLGMTRQEFKECFPQAAQRQEFLNRIMDEQWVVTYSQIARKRQSPLNWVVEFRRLVQARSQSKINEEQATRIDKLEETLRSL